MEEIKSLKQFYDLMLKTRQVKKDIFDLYVKDEKKQIQALNLIKKLQNFQAVLETIPNNNGRYSLKLDGQKMMVLDLSYEINELKKDIFFLTHSEEEFDLYLEQTHQNFKNIVGAIFSQLKNIEFRNFITDRDGTVNNYCGRYGSSIQSVYNAVFLYRFAVKAVENSILLTSAPLDNNGMVDISLLPKEVFIYAGSKGREYFDRKGLRHQFPVEKEQQQMLDILNDRLKQLLKKPEYAVFPLIGSGLQLKFGQTTIARQDISGTIPESESIGFLKIIRQLVQQIDADNKFFRIEDTGKDIEIILTIDCKDKKGELKDFDKGDGVNYLDQELKLNLKIGRNLICGDTASDLAMVEAAMAESSNTWTIFVTEDKKLQASAQNVCAKCFFVPEPDMLVAILNLLASK
ncbi:MAG: trehalose 6-phosphate synthase [Candidatus Omnitrophota bacterium]